MTQGDRSTGFGLASKLLAIGSVFLLLALASIGLTLWVTWQLEGGAAAVNEAGRMRMRSYQLALTVSQIDHQAGAIRVSDLKGRLDAFDDTLELLRSGDPARPLSVPWDPDTSARFQAIELDWRGLRQQVLLAADGQSVPP
ncbi:MAG: type IV pili methyl-accepting chemotaxis transducer N-terminal domain-containing protein, partial [Burkholderiales bacterium]|nr:type IV pili methyl-accepting chemotaxis transducer N-terminal domain-containing protein [Burkholderiales bacterium]